MMNDILEARIKALEEQNKTLQQQVQTLQDIENIKKLEIAYGYYLEHFMYDEVADLWTDGGRIEWIGLGISKGKTDIAKHCRYAKEYFRRNNQYLHLSPQICPYITIGPDGNTANGRWYAAGGQSGASFIYENTYVKENGLWKIDVMKVGGLPRVSIPTAPNAGTSGSRDPGESMTPEKEESLFQELMSHNYYTERISRVPRQEWPPYICPFHFKHPVTGKDVNQMTVEPWNKAHPAPMPPGGEKWTAKNLY